MTTLESVFVALFIMLIVFSVLLGLYLCIKIFFYIINKFIKI